MVIYPSGAPGMRVSAHMTAMLGALSFDSNYSIEDCYISSEKQTHSIQQFRLSLFSPSTKIL